ncbi:hypothetical protein ACSBR2_005171 [Camellia fascicularis]
MVMHQPLFDGHSKISHLHQIFSIMGTPDATTWPGVTSLPDYRPDFPKQDPKAEVTCGDAEIRNERIRGKSPKTGEDLSLDKDKAQEEFISI